MCRRHGTGHAHRRTQERERLILERIPHTGILHTNTRTPEPTKKPPAHKSTPHIHTNTQTQDANRNKHPPHFRRHFLKECIALTFAHNDLIGYAYHRHLIEVEVGIRFTISLYFCFTPFIRSFDMMQDRMSCMHCKQLGTRGGGFPKRSLRSNSSLCVI